MPVDGRAARASGARRAVLLALLAPSGAVPPSSDANPGPHHGGALLSSPHEQHSDSRLVYVYTPEDLGVPAPSDDVCPQNRSNSTAGEMWCIEHELPTAIQASSVATDDRDKAHLFIIGAVHSLSRKVSVPTQAYEDILHRLQHESPHWNASNGSDHVWISAMSFPIPPEWARRHCILWLANGEASLWSKWEREMGLEAGSIANRTVIVPASMPPPPAAVSADREAPYLAFLFGRVSYPQTQTRQTLLRKFASSRRIGVFDEYNAPTAKALEWNLTVNRSSPRDPVCKQSATTTCHEECAACDESSRPCRSSWDSAVTRLDAIDRAVTRLDAMEGLDACRTDAQSPMRWLQFVPEAEERLTEMCSFMLCPRGGPALWTPRPALAVKAGVVPVLLEEESNHVLRPFHRTYEWSEIAISLEVPRQLDDIEPTLEASLPERQAMLERAAPLRQVLEDASTIATAALEETWPMLEPLRSTWWFWP
jgi:hypothetical protein